MLKFTPFADFETVMATGKEAANGVSASTEGKARRSPGHALAEWNRAYADTVKKMEVADSDEANNNKGRTLSPTSSGKSGTGNSHDDTSGTTESCHHNSTSHSSRHLTSRVTTGSAGFSSSQADGSGKDNSRGDGSGSGSDTTPEESFANPRDMTPIATDPQASFNAEHDDNFIGAGSSHHFDANGLNLAQGMIHSNAVGGSGNFYSLFEGFQEHVKANYPMHGCPYPASFGESLNSFESGLDRSTALWHQSCAQQWVEQKQTPFKSVTLNQHSAAFQVSARSPQAKLAVMDPGLARLLHSVPPHDWAKTTTVMLRDVPVKYNRQMLLKELERAGFLDGIHLVYLPIVKRREMNRGYAFIVFISPTYAWAFTCVYDGRPWTRLRSGRVARVIRSNRQGFEANYTFYSNEWMKDPEARPWINPKLASPASFVGFACDAPHEFVGQNWNTLSSTPTDYATGEPDFTYQTGPASEDHFMTEEWYL